MLNDSAAWTEEIARYLLIAVVFIGATIGVAKNNHIQVDFFYRFMPTRDGRVPWRRGRRAAHRASSPPPRCSPCMMMLKLGSNSRMTMVDLPMNWVYGVCLLGFAAMALRSVQVRAVHRRRGYTRARAARVLDGRQHEQPEHSMLKIIFLLLMSGGIPVAIAMAGSSLIYIWWTGNLPAFVVIHRMVSGIDSFPLLAVPFFILAGNLMNNAGITNRIYNFALALVGWLKGGLGHVNVVGSVIFAGMSGTAIADAAGLGTIEIKAMKDHGYSTEFAVGVTAASATLGPIIPP